MLNFLKKVKKEKLEIIEDLAVEYPISQLRHMINYRQKFYRFKHAIGHGNRISVIAEIKYASPSKGVISNPNRRSPVDIALEYQGAGADAISILTDEKHFHGSFEYLRTVRDFVELPILCKDFFVRDYQIYLACAMGADAVLLIAAMLDDKELEGLYQCARHLGCDVLFEAHTGEDIERIMRLDPDLIGVNSRDLKSLKVDVSNFSKYMPMIPEDKIRVAESGISVEVLPILKQLRVDAVLVGEYFMRQANIYYSLRRFIEHCIY